MPENYTAKGLSEAQNKLDEINLTDEEKAAYKAYLKRLRDIASEQHTKIIDTKKLIEEALTKSIKKHLKRGKLTIEEIAEDFEVSIDFIEKIRQGI